MRKHMLRALLGAGYVCLLTTLLLYQAGLFGERRESVAVLGTLLLGVALAVVLALYLRVNDQIRRQMREQSAPQMACGAGKEEQGCAAAEERAERETVTGAYSVMSQQGRMPLAEKGSQTATQSYEEIYACFLAVMEACTLSERELEVAWLLYRGYTNRQIGESLYIAETTVKKHVSHIYQKMDVCSRKEFRGKVQAGALSGSHVGG